MYILNNTEPKNVWRYFEEISAIPRGSGNEKEICDYFENFAKQNNLWYKRDEHNNILIRKEAYKGYERAEGVILQGHMDMVCEKKPNSNHDFLKDPIKIVKCGDFIKANGTTLGGDDGIAAAIILAILSDKSIESPFIEALLTSDEEVGMKGAINFDYSLLKSTRLINIDSEEEGEIIAGCAGGMRAEININTERKPVENNTFYQISISGLKGGHSGSDIHLKRANAIKLMARVLNKLEDFCDICEITGGNKDNAIPRETKAIVCVDYKNFENLNNVILDCKNVFNNEYSGAEGYIDICVDKIDIKPKTVLSKNTFKKIVDIINIIPFGVVTMSAQIEGLVESSNNIGVIRTYDDKITITSAPRSSVISRRDIIEQQFISIGRITGANVVIRGKYPAWEYKEKSNLRDIAKKTYKELFGKDSKVNAIHAGLECGIFSEKMPDLDIVSIGPNMEAVHTTEEKLSVSSVERIYSYIVEILKRLK